LAAGIIVAFGAAQVSASLKTDEKLAYNHKNNYCCSSDWKVMEYNNRIMNLNFHNPKQAVAWAGIQMDADCPLFILSYSANANRSNADLVQHHDISVKGFLSITEQCDSLGQEEGDNTPILR
jgi:hypothetical protein